MAVVWSWSLSVTTVSSAKIVELIVMPFRIFLTWVGSGNHVLDGGPGLPMHTAILRGKGRPIVKYRDSAMNCAKNGWTTWGCLRFGLGWTQAIVYMWWDNLEGKRCQPMTCLAVDILKVTQQGASPVQCGCWLGCSRWGARCTLVPPGKYEWTICVQCWCSLMSGYFDHLLDYVIECS